jgi:hypothetical protein
MTIFFTASHRGEAKYKKQFDRVYQTIKSFSDVSLISPGWKDNYEELISASKKKKLQDPRLIEYEAIKKGIQLADAVIIEVSQESFQLGHETTLTLMNKKPVLCLSMHEDFNKRISHDYFFGAQYTDSTLKGIIQDFLSQVRDLSLSKRFNLFLYPRQVEYLEINAKKNKMNMSEYIRYLINRDKSQES